MRKLLMMAGAAVIASCFATGASAVQIDFGSATGDIGSNTKVYGGLVTATGYYVTDTDWGDGGGITYNDANLYERNQAQNDIGVGICNSGDGACTDGDDNEIDNNGSNTDILRLALADGYEWVLLGLSSLDDAGNGNSDEFQMFSSNSANPDLTLMASELSGDENTQNNINPVFALATANKYLFITGGSDLALDDFLVKFVEIRQGGGGNEVPEPASLALLGAGLLGLGLFRRRKA